MRIKSHPILKFEKKDPLTFYFEDKAMVGYQGDTIASALYDNGVSTLSYSERAHEPMGLYCAIGNCSSCLMRVNDVANVRVCVEPLKEGDRVHRQEGKGDLI